MIRYPKIFKELSDQSEKRICVIIDEAHRSQEGKLHQGVTDTFSSDDEGVEQSLPDVQEKFLAKIERKTFPNLAFIALTATPTEKTLEHFGQQEWNDAKGKSEWVPFDTYSMDQAIAEGYIMDVAKHIYAYDTLYELNKEVDTQKEYLPMMVKRALKQKAFEDDEIIKEKCNRIINIFKNESALKIASKAKSMIVTSSRLAAVKYKFYLDAEIKKQNVPYKSLVAFSGSIPFKHESTKEESHTEDSLNKNLNPKNEKIEDVFEMQDNIRFLIVANKFQTGFSEALLHTMFVDKPLRDKTAVQTLSRLNRIHPDKKDTLVVDFSGSYEQIMKAYKKYQSNVTTIKTSDPNQLYELKESLLQFGIFTLSDVEDIARLGKLKDNNKMAEIAGITHRIKTNFEEDLSREKRDDFRTLMNRYIGIFYYIQVLYHIPDITLKDFQLFLIYLRNKLTNSDFNSLKKELEDVKVVNYAIPEQEKVPISEPGDKSGGNPTTIKKETKTVQEVIDEINLRFREQLGEEGMTIVSNFFKDITNDESLRTIIKNNFSKDSDKIYNEIVKDKLKEKLTDKIMETSPEKYADIMSDNVFMNIGKTAYKILRDMVKAA